ncbi:MAG: ATP-binding cassette domain-containing protein [Coprobacillus sp.]
MLELKHIYKRYDYQLVLDDVSMTFDKVGMIGIIGPSGCGKSTLLHIIGGIDKDFNGDMLLDNKSVKWKLATYRKKHVSFIFQQFHLIMWLSSIQNLSLSRYFTKYFRNQKDLDVSDFKGLKMSSLSHGQRQRIAYLRASYQQSDILLCDEPTGSLDPESADKIMSLLKEESLHKLVIIVSHDKTRVEKLCDEIYEMKDGKIINHFMKRESHTYQSVKKKKQHTVFPKVRLSLLSLFSHKARSLQMVFGLTISLLCIVLALTMSRGLQKQLTDYVYSLVPSSSLSFQLRNKESLSLSQQAFQNQAIVQTYYYLDEYEFLGIGFVGDKYQESQVLFIGDDASPYKDLTLHIGNVPSQKQDILVSLSTAQHLCKDQDVGTLIGKKVYAWYKYERQVKAIEYRVVGITSQKTSLDTIYQMPNAYIDLLKDVYQFDIAKVKSHLGIIYVDKKYERSDIKKQLEGAYPSYKFLEVGASTVHNMNNTMEQVKIVLYIFSFLAIISSLFLIGEVMFLNVVQKRKDLAIMKCFGATTFDLIRIVLYESLEILIYAQVSCALLYYQLLKVVNTFVSEAMLSESLVFSFDYELLLYVYGFSFLLVFISQIIPLFYVAKMNTIEALKN